MRKDGFQVIAVFIFLFVSISTGMATEFREDALIGKIIDSSSLQEISKSELIEKMLSMDVIYLGEKHDNAAHHQHQLWVIEQLLAKGERPAIGFEFFHQSQTGELNHFVFGGKALMHMGSTHDPEKRLRKKLGWTDREDWKFYFPMLSLAKQYQLPTFGADLSSGLIARITRFGVSQLNPIELAQIPAMQPASKDYRFLMYQKFKASHCGWGEEKMLQRLFGSWQARNSAMASAIVKMLSMYQPIVMIVGKGHNEHNMGLYAQVEALQPNVEQMNLGLMEIAIEPQNLKDYVPSIQVGNTQFKPIFEYLWFSQRHDYDDPCEPFRNHK